MQQGSVLLMDRKEGPKVWSFRWSERDSNGRRTYMKRVIGTLDEYEDEASVRKAALGLLPQHRHRHERARSMTIDQLCEHLEQYEIRSGSSLWSIATLRTYRCYIRRWIRPRWGTRSLDDVKAVEVEA